jgi:N-acetylglucosamine-6-phosphate deacetylase
MSEAKHDRVVRGDVVTPDAVIPDAFVAVRDGTIAQVGTGPAPAADRVDDYRGCLLFHEHVRPVAHGLMGQVEPLSRTHARRPRGGDLSARGDDL